MICFVVSEFLQVDFYFQLICFSEGSMAGTNRAIIFIFIFFSSIRLTEPQLTLLVERVVGLVSLLDACWCLEGTLKSRKREFLDLHVRCFLLVYKI